MVMESSGKDLQSFACGSSNFLTSRFASVRAFNVRAVVASKVEYFSDRGRQALATDVDSRLLLVVDNTEFKPSDAIACYRKS